MKRFTRVRWVVTASALLVALLLPASAGAASKALWFDDEYDKIARTISGVSDVRLLMEDNYSEWALLGVDANTLGFTCILAYPGHWCYHRIYISPEVSTDLGLQQRRYVWDMLTSGATSIYDGAWALTTFIHETYHWRLFSRDESRVQACAIRDFSYWLENAFRIPRTIQQTQVVPTVVTEQVEESYQVRQKYRKRVWVKRNGKRVRVWVTRYRTVTRTRLVTVTKTVDVEQVVTVPNPLHTNLVSTASAIYAGQAPPYGGGTCA